MKLCPTCQRCYEDTDSSCSQDNTPLVTARAGTRLLAGKYRLDKLLGRGDKGIAYAATDVELDTPIVAVELHQTGVIDDPLEMQRFHREARAAARANNQDVADIYDYGSLPDGKAYIVMELIERPMQRKGGNISPVPTASPTIKSSAAPTEAHRHSSSGASVSNPETVRGASTEETRTALPPPPMVESRHVAVDDAVTIMHEAVKPEKHKPDQRPPAAVYSRPADADRNAKPTAPILVKVPGKTSTRRRPLVYIGLPLALALGLTTIWLASRRTQSPSSNTSTASIPSPTTNLLPTVNPPASETVPPAATVANDPPPVMTTRSRTTAQSRAAQAKNPRAVLRQTLDEWLSATASGNIENLMAFYMPTVETFYSNRNVPQADLRAEKARLFAEEKINDIRLIGDPQITFSDGGRVATMRIRLSYATEDGGQNRRREVMRELRWRKTDEGWMIFSERDV